MSDEETIGGKAKGGHASFEGRVVPSSPPQPRSEPAGSRRWGSSWPSSLWL